MARAGGASEVNAFSKDYQSGIDWSPVTREARMSRINSEKRSKALASDDPEVRRKAIHNLGDLSAKVNKKILLAKI